jgi:molybdopterin synthase sulfur carrier subunit
MKITILYFASLRDYIGKADDCLESKQMITAKQAWDIATQSCQLPSNTLVAVNQNYVTLDTPLQDGDELAFFPPVTGG